MSMRGPFRAGELGRPQIRAPAGPGDPRECALGVSSKAPMAAIARPGVCENRDRPKQPVESRRCVRKNDKTPTH